MVEVLKRLIESRIEKKAFKLHCILNSPEHTSIDRLDELLTEYVMDVNKIKMLNEIINSSTQQQVQPEDSQVSDS
tara:strand:- start:264 stop:488 length:225 start_codon:yes stop_codon:yes gene_type:complete